jgi:hypothetical protein
MMPRKDDFLDLIIPKPPSYDGRSGRNEKIYRLGYIDSDYLSGRPSVVFDGEELPSEKQYPYISSYTPTANDRVLLLKIADSYVILGKII